MKWTTATLALVLPLAVLAAPSWNLQFQQDAIVEPATANADADGAVPSLSVDDHLSIQASLRNAVEHLGTAVEHGVEDILRVVEDLLAGDERQDEVIDAADVDDAAPEHRGPPRFIDFSDYTILEILNATLHNPAKHHDGPHKRAAEVRGSDENVWPKLPWPHHPPVIKEPKDLPLHKLAWIVNKSSVALADLDKDGITLLAPDDLALTPRHRRSRRGRGPKKPRRFVYDEDEQSGHDGRDADIDDMAEQLENELRHQPLEHPFLNKKLFKHKHDDADFDEDKKEKISKIIGLVLKYHTLSSVKTAWSLVNHSTIPTTLNRGPEDDEPLRLKVEPALKLLPFPHPTLKFNFYAEKRGPTIKAKNGLIHLVSAPLLPPFSALNELFLFPQFFSTLTSSIQKVDLAKSLKPTESEQVDENTLVEDMPAAWSQIMDELISESKVDTYTVFAPTNGAFFRLGWEINALLQSPFKISYYILKYVIAYHIVPDIALFSDYVFNATGSSAHVVATETDVDLPIWASEIAPDFEQPELDTSPQPFWETPSIPGFPGRDKRGEQPPPEGPPDQRPGPPPGKGKSPHHPPGHPRVNITHYSLPTLLVTSGVNPNATLHVAVVSYRRLFGKGPIKRDIFVLPYHPHHHGEKYEDLIESGDESFGTKPCISRPRPVKVVATDAVVRNGVLQPVVQLLRPPPYHHEEKKGEKSKIQKNAFKALFA